MAKELRLIVAVGLSEVTEFIEVPDGWDGWHQAVKDEWALDQVEQLASEVVEGWYEEVEEDAA